MKLVKFFLIAVVLITVLVIIFFDLGNFMDHDSGAGDIWWTESEELINNISD